MESEIRSTPVGELRFVTDSGKPRIDARAILFDSWSVDLGGFRERMMPGSVNLDADLVALFDHDTSMVLGRVSAGTMTVTADERGVAFTAFPPETTWAKDLSVSMSRGDIKGCSYRMMVEEDKWYVDMNGQVCRDVIKASISELTVTSMPAYPATSAEARSHAQALAAKIPADIEERAGRVLSTDNQGRLVLAKDVINMATEMLEKATENIDSILVAVDPTYVPESEDDGMEGGCDCGGDGCDGCGCSTAGDGMTDPNCACPDGECATCNPKNSESMDGASNSSRSSDGASETQTRTATFVSGFGFIPNPRKR